MKTPSLSIAVRHREPHSTPVLARTSAESCATTLNPRLRNGSRAWTLFAIPLGP